MLIFISKAASETFRKNFNIADKKKVVIYNGVSDKFLEKVKKEPNKDLSNIIFVGRLEKVKGVDILIKAFEKVYQENTKTKLTIIGDGSERNQLESLAESIKRKRKCFFFRMQKRY